jgi:hypothetical protein
MIDSVQRVASLKPTQIRPASQKIEIEGMLSVHYQEIGSYWWVNASDLIQSVDLVFSRSGRPDKYVKTMKALFERYGLVCGRRGETPVLTWVTPDAYGVDVVLPPPDEPATVLVPSGFSNNVLDLAQKGYERVVARKLVASPSFGLVAVHVSGEEQIIIRPEKHGPFQAI